MSDCGEQAVGPDETGRPGRIVVGVDGGPAAAAAVRWAAAQSRLTDAPLHAVHSWQLRSFHPDDADTSYRRVAIADARARATRWVITALGDDHTAMHWTLGIIEDAPGPALVAQSLSASLLVLGTGEHVGPHRLVVGSVSRYVLTHALPPIVAVRAPRAG